MSASFPFTDALPAAADPAVTIVRQLVQAGHQALLAGGCVRDLLLKRPPHDYDVVTDAPPEDVQSLFPSTRLVGAQFGVVLVRQRRRWVEVATFRADGPYQDGRRPTQVTFADAREDARRRDFTINGMFLDPLDQTVTDYVGGWADLQARLIRAIGTPAARFAEDHLRLVRAVRFAARLDFTIESTTLAAVQAHAAKLSDVAAERVREELEKMLGHAQRRRAFALLRETGLLPHLWPDARWEPEQLARADALLGALPAEVPFALAFATLVADRAPAELHAIGRSLAFSNEQRESVAWLVQHQADLDEPDALPLAALKRLIAQPGFGALRQLAAARWALQPNSHERNAALEARLAAIAPETVQPPPLVTGSDLVARGVAAGPIYKELLDTLYTQQLDEKLGSRAAALAALDGLLRQRGVGP